MQFILENEGKLSRAQMGMFNLAETSVGTQNLGTGFLSLIEMLVRGTLNAYLLL